MSQSILTLSSAFSGHAGLLSNLLASFAPARREKSDLKAIIQPNPAAIQKVSTIAHTPNVWKLYRLTRDSDSVNPAALALLAR